MLGVFLRVTESRVSAIAGNDSPALLSTHNVNQCQAVHFHLNKSQVLAWPTSVLFPPIDIRALRKTGWEGRGDEGGVERGGR